MRKIIHLLKGINSLQMRIKLKDKLNQEINPSIKEELNNTEISPRKISISRKESKLSGIKAIPALMMKWLPINTIKMLEKNSKVQGSR